MSAAPAVELGNDAAYQAKLTGLLGDRDPLAVLAATPDAVTRLMEPHPAATLRLRPFPGKWTPLEIVGHLGDTEWLLGYRVRLILCQDRPTILAMDQDQWVAGQGYNALEPADVLRQFRDLRRHNLALWRRMSAADLQRVGLHAERGPENLGLMLRMEAGHDLSHIDQLTRYLAAIAGPR